MSMDVNAQIKAGLDNIDQQVKAAIAAGNEQNAQALQDVEDQLGTLADQIQSLEQREGQQLNINEAQSMGMEFVASASFKDYASGVSSKASFNMPNAEITTNETISPPERKSEIVKPNERRLFLENIVNSGPTQSSSIQYVRETLYANNAEAVSEGSGFAFPTSDLDWELVSVPVQNIGHTIPISQQVVEDAPMMVSYIDGRMRYGALAKKDLQMLNGDGTGVNLKGLLHVDNHVGFTPAASSNPLENIRRAITVAELSEYFPDTIILNPLDVETLDLDKDANGNFRNTQNANPWGLRLMKSTAMPQGKFLVGAFDGCHLWNRRGVTVSISSENSTNFEENMLTMKADLRAALEVTRPASFVSGALTA